MKISINNFKSIGSLANYEIQPLTILSGTNSSGKSSFIQLLLLLKQTLEDGSTQRPLDLQGKLFPVRNYLDILKGKTYKNRLKVEFVFNKSELSKYTSFQDISIYDAAFDSYNLKIVIEFDYQDAQIIVTFFQVKFILLENENQEKYIQFENGRDLNVKTDNDVFINRKQLLENGEVLIKDIRYSAFIPIEIEYESSGLSIALPNGTMSEPEKTLSKVVPHLQGVKTILMDLFNSLNYIGPLRQAPKEEYSFNETNNSVGVEGENVAEVLYKLASKNINYFRIEEKEEVINFVKSEGSFISAVKYWLCERFRLCSDIYIKKEAETYLIYITSLSGIESNIKHVGIGISQVLPIVVEGLRIGVNEILVLEQPEIHLHPKVQSDLTDFFISLIENGKKVIVETHSDHLITRLRRRIAEDQSSRLENKVLLTFVEVGKNDVLFKNISIDDFGVLEFPYPDDFIEKTDTELKAILKAQMRKRLKQQGK